MILQAAREWIPALFATLWQGTAIALLAWTILRLVRFNAATRYAILFVSLICISLLPALNLPGNTRHAAARPGFESGYPAPGTAPASPSAAPFILPARVATVLLLAWIAVAILHLLKLTVGVGRLMRIKRRASPIPNPFEIMPRGARVAASADCGSPVTAGYFRPMILLPSPFAAALSAAELGGVVRHELAHVRRRDDWTLLAQRILEAVLFFHPAAWWIGRRLNLEREIACDDLVIGSGAGERAYARCLLRLAELIRVRGAWTVPAPGVFSTRTQLSWRIDMLLKRDRTRDIRVSMKRVLGALTLLACALLFLSQASPVVAVSEEEREAAVKQARTAESVRYAAEAQARMAEEAARAAEQKSLRAQEEMRRSMEQMNAAAEQMQRASEQMRRTAEQMRAASERAAMELSYRATTSDPLPPSPALAPMAPMPPAVAVPAPMPRARMERVPRPEVPPAPPVPPVAAVPAVAPAPELPEGFVALPAESPRHLRSPRAPEEPIAPPALETPPPDED